MFAPTQIGRRTIPFPFAILIGAITYLIAVELGSAFAQSSQCAAPVWPAAGLGVALLKLAGRRLWPAVLLGAWMAGIAQNGLLPSSVTAIGDTLEALLAAELLARLEQRGNDHHFLLARSIGYALAATIAPVASTVLDATTLWIAGSIDGAEIIALLISRWAGDALGILILTPALLSLAAFASIPSIAPKTAIMSRSTVLLGAACLVVGSVLAMALSVLTPKLAALTYLILPVSLLAAKWLDARVIAWLTLVFAVSIISMTMLGAGPFVGGNLAEDLLNVQIFLGALSFASLVFSDLSDLDLRMAGVVFCVGCALSTVVFALSSHIETELSEVQFGKVAEAAVDNIRQRLEIYADSLRAGSAFYAASNRTSRKEWHDYASSLDLVNRYPGIRGIGVIVPVSPADVERFVADARRDNAPDFDIKTIAGGVNPRTPTEDHLVVLYIEPLLGNSQALGIDLTSEERRRRAALAAEELGQPQMTDAITLVQDTKRRAGFSLYMPVYQSDMPLTTTAQRRAAFRGIVYAPFVAETFFRAILQNWNHQILAQVFDGDRTDSNSMLFSSSSQAATADLDNKNHRELRVDILGHRFTIRLWPNPAFSDGSQRASVVLGAGLLLLSTLFAALIANLQSTKERAANIARQMTEALARSTERFELAFAGSQDGIWDWTLSDETFWASPRCWEMLGYSPEEKNDDLAFWRSAMHPDDLKMTVEATRALFRRDVPRLDIVQRYRHRNGHFVHLHNRALAIYRDDGWATRIIGALTDITPLLRAEERLRTAISVIDAGFALFDAEDRLVLFNEGFLNASTRNVMVDPMGCTFEEIFTAFAYGELTAMEALPDRSAWLRRRIELHRNPPPEPFEVAWTDGRWLRVLERRLSDGATVIVWTDITFLKLAERRLQDAIESINEGFALFDSDLRYVMTNSHLRDMHPISASHTVSGQRLEDMLRYGAEHGEYPDINTPEDIEAFVQQWISIFSSDEPFVGECRFSDGRWALVSHHRTSDGGYVTIWADITAQKQREAELEQAKKELEEKAAQLTRLAEDLDRARRAADEANRGKSRFLANTSHELRTPLTAILGFSDVMSSEIFGKIEPPIYREYIDLIHESGEHLLSLINDILDLSKIEAGKMNIDIHAISTADLVRQSSSLMRVLSTERGIDLVLDVAQDCPVLHADQRAARQIILNLLSNAIKFTPGGGCITLAVRSLGESGFEISVTDTGIGMTEDEVERALQLYVQVDSDVARMALGTGIGLPLVKALAELHGGSVTVSSRKRKGTTVTVTLPWQDHLPRVLSPVASSPTERPSHQDIKKAVLPDDALHVLVVDDNEINQSLITVILNRMSLQVDCAPDGLTGVEMAAARHYDLIIMDVQMPRLDGIEATRRIRVLASETSLSPIIALTADAEGTQRERCLAAGMTEVLAKPIVPPLLVATVTRLLRKRIDASLLVN